MPMHLLLICESYTKRNTDYCQMDKKEITLFNFII